MTLQKSSNSPKGGGKLLKIDSGANAGKLQRECCCVDDEKYMEFKVCPNCTDAFSSCGCGSSDPYEFRTSCTADPATYDCPTHGFNAGSSCDSDDDSGAIYIAIEQLVAEIPSRVLFTSEDGPEYFHTAGIINLNSDGEPTSVSSLYFFRFTDSNGKRGFMKATGQIRDGSTLTGCQIRGAGIIFNERDCAGNVKVYGPNYHGLDGASINCDNLCRRESWVKLTPCEPGECTCFDPDLDDCYHARGEFAAGIWHLGCDSCSSCNPADARGKFVADGDTYETGNGSWKVGSEVVYVDPKNGLFNRNNFSNQTECPCGYEPFGPPDIFSNNVGDNINCDYECEGGTVESPFDSCTKATRTTALNELSQFICEEEDTCECCCPDNTDYPSCPSTISLSVPGITTSSNAQYPLGFAIYCIQGTNDDGTEDGCFPPLTQNSCDCIGGVPGASIPLTQVPGTCEWRSADNPTNLPVYGVSSINSVSLFNCQPEVCGDFCSPSSQYPVDSCGPNFLIGWTSARVFCSGSFDGSGASVWTATANFKMISADGQCGGIGGVMFYQALVPEALTRCPGDAGPYESNSITANPGSSPIGGNCIDLGNSLPKIANVN